MRPGALRSDGVQAGAVTSASCPGKKAFGMEDLTSGPTGRDELSSLEVRVVGRVQGVGFRFFAHDVGRRLRLRGYVTNLSDGTVRACAEGPRRVLEEFLRQMARGPGGAHVREIRTHWGRATGRYAHFSIERSVA